MRLRFWMVCLLAGTVGAVSILPAWAQSESYQYIDIRNPFLRKIPLAVPLFKNQTGGPREDENSRKAVDLLAGSLDFTGYFKILDRGAFLFDPQKSGVGAADINFQNWTVIGAELLITGVFEQSGTAWRWNCGCSTRSAAAKRWGNAIRAISPRPGR